MSRHKLALRSSAGLALLCLAGMVNAGGEDGRESERGAQDQCRQRHCYGRVGDTVVVADGLHSPRGLDFAANGQLFVAEAGDEANGYSETGLVSRIDYWLDAQYSRVPVLTHLPTYGDVGPADVSFDGMKAYVPIGLGTNANNRDALTGAKKALLGSLISFNPGSGAIKNVADVAALERAAPNVDGYINDPNAQRPEDLIDSNPFGVLALQERRIVVDAGANAMYAIKNNGRAKLLAVLTAEGFSQHVPSRVAQGPDGYLYLGEEAFSLNQALVYKIPPDGCDTPASLDCKSHFLTDPKGNAIMFGHIMDLEFDRSGNLYVLEFPGFGPPSPYSNGNELVKVDRRGNKTVIYSGLSSPGGMTLSPDGRYAYVSNRTTCWGVVTAGFAPPGTPPPPPGCAATPGAQPGDPGLYGQVLRIALTAY